MLEFECETRIALRKLKVVPMATWSLYGCAKIPRLASTFPQRHSALPCHQMLNVSFGRNTVAKLMFST
jgi:hypothetical protein